MIRQLNLILDESGILRCRSRFDNSMTPTKQKNPILLPRSSWLTRLVILEAHQIVFHGRIRETLAEVRERYWIPQGRKAVKSVLRKCVDCIKNDGEPYAGKIPPPLPRSRVTEGMPFQFTGVDLAGPIFVKSKIKDGVPYKVYISLYTCAVIRAVHLELVEDQAAPAFIRSFRRFISRRGIPEEVISDNAKNFKRAAMDIEELSASIMATSEVQCLLWNKGIKWHFIMERAPWWGGFYERMVGTVKRCLKKTIGRALLTFEELRTVTVEAEAVVNSRSMTYQYADFQEGRTTQTYTFSS